MVAGEYRGIERFGESNVYRVVRREVLAQLPSPRREIQMAMPDDSQQLQVLDGFFRAIGVDLAGMNSRRNALRTSTSSRCGA
jgi:hypothetical protein